jgi:hypothetical protein
VITDVRGYGHSVVRRNPAADSVLAAETLIEQLRRVAPALNSPMPADVAAAIGEVQHIYPEIWANLDRARSMISEDIPQYDDLRARQPAALMGATSINTADPVEQAAIFAVAGAAVASIGAKSAVVNRAGILDAEAALEILRAAVPGVNWHALRLENTRAVDDLAWTTIGARSRRLARAVGVVVGLVLIVVMIAIVLAPSKPEGAELPPSQKQLDAARARLVIYPCHTRSAELIIRDMRRYGLVRDSKHFGEDFMARCGENAAIRRRIGTK